MTESNYKGGEYKVVVTNNAQVRAASVEKIATQTVERTVGTAEQMKNFGVRVNTQAITFAGDTIEPNNYYKLK